jgi:2,5-diketo-D-gluconate reductase B
MLEIPRLGFGTYGRSGTDGIGALEAALAAGYRHFDTAQSYNTESEVGAAIRSSGLARSEVWVTTKIDTPNFGPGRLIPSLEHSIERLALTPDLTLIHWPSPNGELALPVYLDQIAEAKVRGLTREIGVSNFPIALLTEAEARLGKGEILTNQFELNPLFRNGPLAKFCQSKGILVTCYQPVAQGRIGTSPIAAAIAARHDVTVEQVALAWELAKGYAAIPTSSRTDRINSNFAALKLKLSEADIADIETLPQAARSIDPGWGPAWDAH